MTRTRALRFGALAALGLLALSTGPALAGTTTTATYGRQDRHRHPGYAGTQIVFESSKAWRRCGVGVSWRVDGATRLVTAGHCASGMGALVRFHDSSGAKAGTVTALRYGSGHDWALVAPAVATSAYAYTGGPSSRSLLRLDGYANPTERMVLCVSGATRGTSCGWVVTRQIDATNADGQDMGVQTEARHRYVDGSCPADSGDSGSPVYQAGSDGTWLVGMMSAGRRLNGYCTMSFVSVTTLQRQIGGQPITRATP